MKDSDLKEVLVNVAIGKVPVEIAMKRIKNLSCRRKKRAVGKSLEQLYYKGSLPSFRIIADSDGSPKLVLR